ncbi:hypothetical protein GMOD_00009951 [Pyrenophora seminiperda CCB06]|uniref:Uncharacterized protein n=1 Tax=Pyrenophora seminiperda CCB06 TaxID=1302712 RepID=A0A3M7M1F1_9PLEO|nr:hypothetical protein GMOD_00009951 [Pyrenophora seminiperda CCB06]
MFRNGVLKEDRVEFFTVTENNNVVFPSNIKPSVLPCGVFSEQVLCVIHFKIWKTVENCCKVLVTPMYDCLKFSVIYRLELNAIIRMEFERVPILVCLGRQSGVLNLVIACIPSDVRVRSSNIDGGKETNYAIRWYIGVIQKILSSGPGLEYNGRRPSAVAANFDPRTVNYDQWLVYSLLKSLQEFVLFRHAFQHVVQGRNLPKLNMSMRTLQRFYDRSLFDTVEEVFAVCLFEEMTKPILLKPGRWNILSSKDLIYITAYPAFCAASENMLYRVSFDPIKAITSHELLLPILSCSHQAVQSTARPS